MTDVLLSAEPLSLDACFQFVQDPACGGLAFFVGTIRNHNKGETVTHLEFDTYDGMALKEMKKILARTQGQWDVRKASLHHRKGPLSIGDVAVIVAVASPHRAAAFEACQFIIDELKKTVPIWKREFREDGTFWLGDRP